MSYTLSLSWSDWVEPGPNKEYCFSYFYDHNPLSPFLSLIVVCGWAFECSTYDRPVHLCLYVVHLYVFIVQVLSIFACSSSISTCLLSICTYVLSISTCMSSICTSVAIIFTCVYLVCTCGWCLHHGTHFSNNFHKTTSIILLRFQNISGTGMSTILFFFLSSLFNKLLNLIMQNILFPSYTMLISYAYKS